MLQSQNGGGGVSAPLRPLVNAALKCKKYLRLEGLRQVYIWHLLHWKPKMVSTKLYEGYSVTPSIVPWDHWEISFTIKILGLKFPLYSKPLHVVD